MKKAFPSLCLSLLAVTLWAAPEKVASVRIGGTEKIAAAVGKLGQFAGNPALGAMCSGSLMQSEVIQYFGPTRPGANVFIRISADAAKKKDRVSASVLYPVVAKKAKFLKHHKGAVERDGVVTMPKDRDGDHTYVVFAEDGKWAALADTAALAKAALADVAEAERPLGNALVRIDIASRGMAGLRACAEATRAKGRPRRERVDRATLDVLGAIDYLSFAIKVTDAGIDFDSTAAVKPGTELAKVGLSPVDDAALATLGKDVFHAFAIGPDSSLPRQRAWKDFVAFLRGQGFRLDFIAREEKPGFVRLTLDPVAMAAYLNGPATNAFAKLDACRFAKDLEAFLQDRSDAPYAAKNPAGVGAFALRGGSCRFAPAERLKATLPELSAKKPFYVTSGSAYAMLRAVIPPFMKKTDRETQALLLPMMMLLAPEEAPGIASGMWREGDSLRFLARVSGAEIKGFASVFALATAYSSMKNGAADGDEDDSDVDTDDDEN